MTNSQEKGLSCNTMCWVIAAIFGFVVAVSIRGATEMSWILAIIAGALAVYGIGSLITNYFCEISAEEGEATARYGAEQQAARDSVAAQGELRRSEKARDAEEAAATIAADAAQNRVEGSGAKAGSGWSGAGNGLTKTGEDALDTTTYDNTTQAETSGAADIAQPAARVADIPAGMMAAADGKPALYTEKPNDADDLKQIKGVGPGLEKTLNELGIYTFAQITQWNADDIAWVDSNLRFKGRIVRDDWVSQAKTLASGGETDFSKRVEDGGIY